MKNKNWAQILYCVFVFMFLLNPMVMAEEEIVIETAKVSAKWNLPYVSAHSAVLMDVQTGDVLYARDPHRQLPPASTTKIMTAILAFEMGQINEMAIVSEKADQVGESSIYLNKGDKITLGELLEGALIKSGNDACVAIAEKIAGGEEQFVEIMNKKALALGAYDTHFINTNGLPAKNHYSSAYDLALIARYGLQIPQFAEVVKQKYATISFEFPQKNQEVKNTNRLLFNYQAADGVKTGTTAAAGKCLVSSATKDERKLICVVLNAPDRFGDSKRLLEWGFNYTKHYSFGSQGDVIANYPYSQLEIPLVLAKDAVICIQEKDFKNLKTQIEIIKGVFPALKKDDILGYYNIMLEDRCLKRIPLVCREEIKNNPLGISGSFHLIIDEIMDFLENKG